MVPKAETAHREGPEPRSFGAFRKGTGKRQKQIPPLDFSFIVALRLWGTLFEVLRSDRSPAKFDSSMGHSRCIFGEANKLLLSLLDKVVSPRSFSQER